MAGSDTRCPVCGKQVGVGLVSGTLVQHENKFNERCAGTGTAPAPVSTRSHAPRPAGTGATSSTRSTGSRSATGSTGSASRRGTVSVRRVEVDPERLKRLEEKQQRLREERAEAARRRNEYYSSGVSIDEEQGRSADDESPTIQDAPAAEDGPAEQA